MRLDRLLGDARAAVPGLTVAEVAAALDVGDLRLVDVREPDEVARSGRIPGALLVPRGTLEFWQVGRPTQPPIVTYSSTGRRSLLAANTLRELGHTETCHLEGGLTAWHAHGRPVTHRPPPEGSTDA